MKKEPKPIPFSLQGIKTEQFAVFEEHYNPKAKVGFSNTIQFCVEAIQKQVFVSMAFQFAQQKRTFLKIEVSCVFKIQDAAWSLLLEAHPREVRLPRTLMAQLAMVSVGTTRGILFAKTEATPFSKFILPTLNLAETIKEDAVFELDAA
jgi:hypothetical protein